MNSEYIPIEQPELGRVFASEVPHATVTESGREIIRTGDVELAKRTWEPQGRNDLAYGATGGLATSANCLRMFGVDVSEQDAVRHAAVNGLCRVGAAAQTSGGTTATDQVSFLKAFGVPVHLKVMAVLEQIIEAVRDGQGVLVDVNAGALWRDEIEGTEAEQAYRDHYQDGTANHVVQVVGVATDRATSELVGFYVNDAGLHDGAGRFVSAQAMEAAAIGGPEQPVFGSIITTDLARRPAAA
jgi:hypothetical protein